MEFFPNDPGDQIRMCSSALVSHTKERMQPLLQGCLTAKPQSGDTEPQILLWFL